MKQNWTDDVIVIIRSVGERTEQVCKKLILDQGIPENNLIIIRESPSIKAVLKSFEIALEKNLKWTYRIDADIMLAKDSIKNMVSFAQKQKSSHFVSQGYVLCKFFGGIRIAGNYFYNTKLIKNVFDNQAYSTEAIRPDSYILEEMRKSGYPNSPAPFVIGLHDYEQYYKDIYRKCFVHGVKHIHHAKFFSDLWKPRISKDLDFDVAIKAFANGVSYNKKTYIDSKLPVYEESFQRIGANEKNKLKDNTYNIEKIENIIYEWIPDEIYLKNCGTIYSEFVNANKSTIERLNTSIKKRGFFKTIFLGLGLLFKNIGNKIVDAIE